MEGIKKIYSNDIGISFEWKDSSFNLTQIIFRNTGFHLKENEIEEFLEKISDSKKQKTAPLVLKEMTVNPSYYKLLQIKLVWQFQE